MIDLGVVGPAAWDPPPSRRPRRRRVPAVVLVAIAVLVAVPPAQMRQRGPLLVVGPGEQSVTLAGDWVFVTRYVGPDAHTLEVRRAGGPMRWTLALAAGEQPEYADESVVLLGRNPRGTLDAVTARDTRTGAQLWRRTGEVSVGSDGGRLLMMDLAGRLLSAVDPRTGAGVWTLSVPDGAQPALVRSPDHRRVTSLAVLDSGGTLRTFDLVTGAVTGAVRLARSGEVGYFELGRDQVMVHETGAGGGVYDLASGRLVFHVEQSLEGGMSACDVGLWCASDLAATTAYDPTGRPVWRLDGGGLTVLDPATGAEAWRAAGWFSVSGPAGGDLVLGAQSHDASAGPGIRVVDARTGALHRELPGWHYLQQLGDRLLVFRRPEDSRHTILALLNPSSGGLEWLGTSDTWVGDLRCDASETLVACGIIGDMSVWRVNSFAAGDG